MLKTTFLVFNKSKKFIQTIILKLIAPRDREMTSVKILQDYSSLRLKPNVQKGRLQSLWSEELKMHVQPWQKKLQKDMVLLL